MRSCRINSCLPVLTESVHRELVHSESAINSIQLIKHTRLRNLQAKGGKNLLLKCRTPINRNREQDTIMKTKFFSIFFHWVPGAVCLLGGGDNPKRVLFLQKKRSKRKLGRALLCLPYASLRGFYVSSGDTLGRFCL